MMRKTRPIFGRWVLLILPLLFGASGFAQETWWVSNRNDLIDVDFTTVQAAIDAASPEDTIMVYPSNTSYGTGNVTKKLAFITAGFDLDTVSQPNLEYWWDASSTKMRFIFQEGSDGSSVEGFYIESTLTIDKNNLLFRGNRIAGSCTVGEDVDGLKFERNYFKNRTVYSSNAQFRYYCNVRLDGGENIQFLNNIFIDFSGSSSVHFYHRSLRGESDGAVVKNNFFDNNVEVSNAILINNVIEGQVIGDTHSSYNNICTGNIPGDSHNDQTGVDASTIFIGYRQSPNDYSFDEQFRLLPTSPAVGAGIGGVDCGPYGGPTRYRPSGVYDRPLIYQLNVPAEVPTGQDLNVNIKVKINNDGE